MTADTVIHTDQCDSVPPESPAAPTVPTELPPLPTPIGDHDYEAQRAWESRQVYEGLWRYSRSRLKLKKDETFRETRLDENEPGQVIAAKLIGPMVEAVQAAQAAASVALEDKKMCKVSDDSWVLLALPAETLAVVTVLSALAHAEPCTVLSACKDVGAKVKQEWELVLWKQREKAAELQRSETGADWEPNLAALMYKRNDVVDERVFKKWSKKAAQFQAEHWDQDKRVRIGAALLAMLLGVCGIRHNVVGDEPTGRRGLPQHHRDRRIEADRDIPDGTWFEVYDREEGFKTTQIFQLTSWGRQWVANRHHQNSLARPYMLPMICEPLDYEYIEPTQPDAEAEEAPAFFDAAN